MYMCIIKSQFLYMYQELHIKLTFASSPSSWFTLADSCDPTEPLKKEELVDPEFGKDFCIHVRAIHKNEHCGYKNF